MAKMIRVAVFFGTRPEAIKMAPVVKALARRRKTFLTTVCVTGQHRQMLDQVLDLFAIKPDYDLRLMQENQTLSSLTAHALTETSALLREINPDVVLVQGDTTTAMAVSLAAFYLQIKIGHVEAGLRTDDLYNPFPEEANRRIISVLSSFNFAPTQLSFDRLVRESVPRKSLFLTGNTVVDALKEIVVRIKGKVVPWPAGKGNRLVLVTAHRRENFGQPLLNICLALKKICELHNDVEIVYPVHLNPNVRNAVSAMLGNVERVHLIPPLEYDDLVLLMKRSYLILTDSGGIQEEAPTFGKPVLVLRKTTERPEGVNAGVAKLVGTDIDKIVQQATGLLSSKQAYTRMAKAISPYGDGRAADRIVRILANELKGQ